MKKLIITSIVVTLVFVIITLYVEINSYLLEPNAHTAVVMQHRGDTSGIIYGKNIFTFSVGQIWILIMNVMLYRNWDEIRKTNVDMYRQLGLNINEISFTCVVVIAIGISNSFTIVFFYECLINYMSIRNL